ncbi:hypothetical protein QMK47_15945 [Pseudomonas sp. P9_35]|uniref:hypothetical protein n=1 Tax=unclassified Pseudomonas TaxID=196821 RepID=UPI002A36FB91|nr:MULTISPECIES: hypothetical protein [unclassified Pseudomonas]WPN61041.1 hypothetical protein QMK48_15040 [Pseudomonas sp. P9_32]WPN66796.1 hypothetical protein QMK47_15945 [Pseudomonas sp. P9_35]
MPAFGQRGLTGRPDQDPKQSKAKQSKAKQSKAKQSKAKQERDTSSIYVAEPPPSRASSLPHWIFIRYKIHVHRKTCGSELAHDEAGTSNIAAN